MNAHRRIDVSFDFRSDTPGYPKNDPDALSPTLRQYHQWLWSKPLPSGVRFELSDAAPGAYLYHRSTVGEFWLASDAVIPTFRKEPRLAHIFEQSPDDLAAFMRIGYTIGGMMLFPGNRVEGKMTINGARGFHPRIKDRFDLTVECIRRHYCHGQSPLSITLQRYAGFFALFGDFRGYVEFFLLQDLVTDDSSAVRFFTPFQDFTTSPLPSSPEAYRGYRQRAIEFIEARNRRILRSLGSPSTG
ncbi:MAG: hypothetical protein IPN47_27705 [Gemmatimonadetes bacterium]|jgi:hypothetical protein|nr:hypothetical protein [Gemmatimonadota bacterium]